MVPKRSANPTKMPNLMQRVKDAVVSGKYRDTTHATIRQEERTITRPEYEYVLKNGYHEPSKDVFKEEYQAWTYSIRGKTVDKRDIRVIISFDEDGLLVITVIELEK